MRCTAPRVSKAETVQQYLSELPDDRLAAIEAVREVILENLPDGFEEVMNWGMITYQVPLSRYPDTYNKKPLMMARWHPRRTTWRSI